MNESEALLELYCQAKTEVFREKPVLVPMYVPQIPHELTGNEP
jgi:hypothetical protein